MVQKGLSGRAAFRLRAVVMFALFLPVLLPETVFSQPLGRPSAPGPGTAPIRHRFIALDEGTKSLVHIDENDSTKNWTVKLPGPDWQQDLQLIGNHRVLVNTGSGYAEFDLRDGSLKKQVKTLPVEGGVGSARRRPNGNTLLLMGLKSGGNALVEVDSLDRLVRKTAPAGWNEYFGVARLTPSGNVTVGTGSRAIEVDWSNRIVWEVKPNGNGKNTWGALRLANGNTWVSAGYHGFAAEYAPDGKVVRKIEFVAPGKRFNYCAGFQFFKNGNLVQVNFLGHGGGHGAKAPGLVEFDSTGTVVWSYQHPTRISSLFSAIVLDGLDTRLLHDDIGGVLQPVAGGTTGLKTGSTTPGLQGRKSVAPPTFTLPVTGRRSGKASLPLPYSSP